MSNAANSEILDDLDGETPSTIKEGFQRWLIVAGLLITFLFIYLFWNMSTDKKDNELINEVAEETVPQLIQDAPVESEAINRFKKDMKSPDRVQYGEKVETDSINTAYAPRKTISYEQSKKEGSLLKNNTTEKEKQTPYEKYIEAEQMRAFKSISAEDRIGDDSRFYQDEPKKSKVEKKQAEQQIKREPLEVKQSRIREQIDAISEYRKAIERGEIDASSPPPGLLNLMEGKR